MPFSIHPYRRFPMQCAVTYHAGPFQGQGEREDILESVRTPLEWEDF